MSKKTKQDEVPSKVTMVIYADGSARPTNPGFGGYGLFGYSYKEAPRPKNTKHPIKGNVSFTHEGFAKDKTDTPIEVVNIYEACIACQSPATTNNIAELAAAVHALDWAMNTPTVAKIIIVTDSSYVVNNFNQNLKGWRSRGFTKQGGEPLSNEHLWRKISELSEQLLFRDVQVQMKWVKGHSDDYGNQVADTYSVVASNAARVQTHNPSEAFVTDIINKVSPYAEFKASYQNKDVLYYFKHIYFSSAYVNDEDHCLVTSVEDETNTGKRVVDSIFAVSKGYVPKLIKDLRNFYRSVPRSYVCTCSVHLKRFENRDILRIAESVDVRFLLVPIARKNNAYSLLNEPGEFLQENTMDYPFIVNINKLYSAMVRMHESPHDQAFACALDPILLESGKLKLSTKDKFLDLTEQTKDIIMFTQKPVMLVGYDIPNYLTLKKIEEEIESVTAVFDKSSDSNFYTLFTKIKTADRVICSVNMLDKYLAVAAPVSALE